LKYKVGDKVRVRKDLIEGERYSMESVTGGSLMKSNSVVPQMMSLRGKEVTIEEINMVGQYKVSRSCFNWTDEMFEGKVGKVFNSLKA